ncbi:calcium/sodium antiporter [Paracoccus liaowanqingii]|uniref:Calcium/sodium antiporter n=1 Tax=Paracoccus liaowanqingii TaxID=2560053 RepID=A0A4P7HMG5_9RHOB|nr:calcium/sodium antiporter [Paracoccus liaowanqingii]QBX34351.1 calcium/sodium antiporter [Paracoccus liaowanqingii]
MTYLLFVLGLVALFFGGELLVRGATAVARHFRLSPMLIGLTIVGFGTSAPEMLVSVQAALAGQPAIAIGNVLGSNIANILLILGISSVIAPLVIPVKKLWRDLGFMLLATAVIWIMLLDGTVTRLDGVLLIAGLVVFLVTAFLTSKVEDVEVAQGDVVQWKAWAMTLGGLIVLVVGARLLVNSSTELARAFGISEAVIGLTIVAVGTSLPELATSLIAAIRKQTEIAVGNIVGSNIFNIFAILGVTALIDPIPADPRFASVDMVWVSASALGLSILAFALGGLPRIAGVALLLAYGGYVVLI